VELVAIFLLISLVVLGYEIILFNLDIPIWNIKFHPNGGGNAAKRDRSIANAAELVANAAELVQKH